MVGKWVPRRAEDIVERRIANAAYYDAAFREVPGVRLPPRRNRTRNVYLLYMIFAADRDRLYQYCLNRGVEAKIHYPIPLYKQKALRHLGYGPGDFPVTDRHAREIITFPVDQHLRRAEQDYVIETVRDFYSGKRS